MNAIPKIPTGFPSFRIDCGDFCVLGCVDANTVFPVCIYRFQNGLGFPRDSKSLGFWVSNRGESALLAHDFAYAKSSVLYLLRPLTLERGCFLAERTISGGSRTGGFCVPPGRGIQDLHSAKSACSGVGGAAQRRGFCKNLRSAAASPGERKVYQTRRSDVSFVSRLPFVPYKIFQIKIAYICRVLVRTFLTAKPEIIVLYEICVMTIFTQSQRILLIGQHEGQHQVDELL